MHVFKNHSPKNCYEQQFPASYPQKSGLNIFLQVLRVIVGVLFIFSGIVKANDPSGLANKMIEFFEPSVLNIPFLIPMRWPFR